MNGLVKLEAYLIPDASMIVDLSQWVTLWTAPATWDEAKALERSDARRAPARPPCGRLLPA